MPSPPTADSPMLELLACPVCYGELAPDTSPGWILCRSCQQTYRIIDGIPTLIPERAEAPPAKA